MRGETINSSNYTDVDWDDTHFKFCEFHQFDIEGGVISADFVSCTFNEVEWYWGLFTGANFIDCKFIHCVFRGTSFADSRFIDCAFTDVKFLQDNLKRDCSYPGTVAFQCQLDQVEGFNPIVSAIIRVANPIPQQSLDRDQ